MFGRELANARITLGASDKRASAAILIAAVVVGTAAAKEILIARTFGVDHDLDLYLIVSAMPLAIVSLFGNAWQSAATPELSTLVPDAKGRRYLQVVRLTALPIALICAAAALGSSIELAPGRISTETLFPVYLALIVLSAALGLMSAGWYPLALSSGRPNLVVAAPAMTHIGIAATVGILGRSPIALYGGLLIGQVALYVALRRYAMPPGLRREFTLTRQTVRRIFRNLLPIVSGGAAMALALPVDLLFAADVTTGGPSILNYATRVPLAASVVGASVISTVAFADLVGFRSDIATVQSRARHWLIRSFGFSVIAAGCVWVLSSAIAETLFASERLAGAELRSLVEVQQMASLSIPPFLVSMVLVRTLNAIAANHPLLWISIANLMINIAGNWLLAPTLGLRGIMLSTAIMYSCSSLLLWLAWRRVVRRRRLSAG